MITPTLDLNIALKWLATQIFWLGREYSYEPPPGGFVNHDETEYDNIVWNDTETKPGWFYIGDNIQTIIQWGIQQDMMLYWPTVKHTVDAMFDAFNAIEDMAAHGVAAVPTDAATDNNVLTAILGGALNTSNTKQNAIGTAVNTLSTWLSTFRTRFNSAVAAGSQSLA